MARYARVPAKARSQLDESDLPPVFEILLPPVEHDGDIMQLKQQMRVGKRDRVQVVLDARDGCVRYSAFQKRASSASLPWSPGGNGAASWHLHRKAEYTQACSEFFEISIIIL